MPRARAPPPPPHPARSVLEIFPDQFIVRLSSRSDRMPDDMWEAKYLIWNPGERKGVEG